MAEKVIKDNKNDENVLENKINPGLTFGLLKGKALAFIKGEITQKELADWGKSLVVMNAIPIVDKMSILMDLTTKYYYTNTNQQEMIVCELYRNIFFTLYLRYLGIEQVFDEENTYENYDIMEPLYGSWIEGIANRDIRIFKEMLNNSINLYTSSNIVDAVNSIDTDAMNKTLQDNKEVLRKLAENKELVQNLRDLIAYNDPMLNKVVEELKQIEVEKQTSQEQINQSN